MHKSSAEEFLACGIDVSAAQLVVALQSENGGYGQRIFPNRASGHRTLILWLQKAGSKVRVCLEATGLYSLDLALALHAACGIEVAVLNPKLVNRFAATLCRSKTDPADAQVLAEYARRMPFPLWQPPRAPALELRAITRHIAALTQQHTRESNRLHAASASSAGARCVQHDLKRSLRDLQHRIDKLRAQALALVQQDPELRSCLGLLLSMPGIGEVSALNPLGELALLAPRSHGPPVGRAQWPRSCPSPIGHFGASALADQSRRQPLLAARSLHARPGRRPPRCPPARLLPNLAATPQSQAASPHRRRPQNAARHLRHASLAQCLRWLTLTA
jgi:hypothetical protein